MDRKLLSLFGLKFNPFSQQVPVEALLATGPVSHFLWRVENLAREGGFAMVDGKPGEGKSAGLRLLQDHLAALDRGLRRAPSALRRRARRGPSDAGHHAESPAPPDQLLLGQ